MSAKQVNIIFCFLDFLKIQEEQNNIALRTRSKLPLTTISLNDIEEAFEAPDITPDMYFGIDDDDWQNFLSRLNGPEGKKTSLFLYNK